MSRYSLTRIEGMLIPEDRARIMAAYAWTDLALVVNPNSNGGPHSFCITVYVCARPMNFLIEVYETNSIQGTSSTAAVEYFRSIHNQLREREAVGLGEIKNGIHDNPATMTREWWINGVMVCETTDILLRQFEKVTSTHVPKIGAYPR